jgi:DNA polymerase (family 10)
VRLRSGIQVDVRVIPQKSYGAALHYFTGSQAHNIAVRTLGVKNNLKINEYGIFKGEKRIAGAQETDVFESIGLPYIEPELREDGGEIQAAQKNELPRLITIEDMCGDLHTHSKHTDGHFTIKEMAEAAREMGYAYIAVTDHSKHVTVTGGLDEKRLMEQIEEIDSIGARLKGITVLKGIEVDILADGSLDLSDDVLKELDLVIGSVHSSFSLSAEKQTGRILRAMDNPYFTILGHPSGRLINEREPYSADMEQIIRAAADRGCYLELNAHPERLDLTDTYCKAAKEAGVKVAISTDAHSLTDLELMRFGIGQARRGWLEAADVINTRSLKELRKLLRSRR